MEADLIGKFLRGDMMGASLGNTKGAFGGFRELQTPSRFETYGGYRARVLSKVMIWGEMAFYAELPRGFMPIFTNSNGNH